MSPKGTTALFMIARILESTCEAPLFQSKYPNPEATTPNHISTAHCVTSGVILAVLPNSRNATAEIARA